MRELTREMRKFAIFTAFTILFVHPSSPLTAPSDVAALRSLHLAVSPSSIPATSCLATWNFASDPCRPSSPTHFTCGLTCNAAATHITAISLDPAGYSAVLPASLRSLSLLAHLHLPSNSFRSALPPLPPSLLSLDLSSNSLSGPIPAHLSTLKYLSSLSLSFNSLSGAIPPLINLPSLYTLDLSFNRLTTLPPSLPTNLVNFAARFNSLKGSLNKNTFSQLHNLEVVDLVGNNLSGILPGWFLQLPSLQQLVLANNSFTGIDMWGAAERLVAIDLSYNKIGGELPRGLAGCPELAAVSVRHNQLRGEIPWEYVRGKKGVALRRLFLDGNFLKGRVPSELLGEEVRGSVGDNCLEGCKTVGEMCSPEQKPAAVCKRVYGAAGRTVVDGRRANGDHHTDNV